MSSIPLNLLVDPSNFPPGPPGPPGAGIVADQKFQKFPSGQNTLSQDFVATGIYLEMNCVNLTDIFEIDACGVAGSSYTGGTHVPLALARNGVLLLDTGQTAHSAPFVGDNTRVAPWSIMMADVPGVVGNIRYELWFKSFASAAYLGRRGSDPTTFSIPAMLRLRRLIAP